MKTYYVLRKDNYGNLVDEILTIYAFRKSDLNDIDGKIFTNWAKAARYATKHCPIKEDHSTRIF